ncbi:MAG TPA: prepilin-type N-terminal cleavage/methylation domain-containing protein [Longimicrobium sp.]|nr:prepilin-type N-terminal cleavage/methylation domain-containing protein [Longimicrobium sp.]
MNDLPRTPCLARSRAGFTLVELMVVLLVASIVGAMAWTLAQVGTSVHLREVRRADAERTRRNLETSVGRALEQTARAGFSAPNLGMLRAGVANTAAGAPADTLVLLRSTGAALPVASRPCRVASASICIALRGDRAGAVHAGDVLAVGSSRVGYRLLQVTSVDGPYAAPCGADCPAATFCSVAGSPGVTVVEVLLGTRSTGGAAPSCSESFYPDGSRCQETRAVRTTSPRARSVCSATGAQALFTDLRTSDRTAALGYPAAREWSGISGGGAPAVAAVPVEPLRLFAVPEGSALAVHLARGMAAGGSWNAARRVAGPVASFQVETQHAGTPGWTRGDGVDAATLAVSPNRVTHTVPGADALGYTYARGYHTLVAVRLETDVVGMNREGTRTTEPLRILQSLSPLARGGAREEP